MLGILMSLAGFGSILLDLPVYCCGFAIFGPILFLVGLYKALRSPPQPAMYYPPPYAGPPTYYPPPPTGAPAAPAPPGSPTVPAAPPLPAEAPGAMKRCDTCGAENRGDAKFCTSCGVPM